MASENGEDFLKNLAAFVRTHEKALANALQLRRVSSTPASPDAAQTSFLAAHSASSLTAALSSAVLPFSQPIKPAKLTLTPHHLFYLLSRFEELGIDVGPTHVRLENIHADSTPGSYVSFLNAPPKPQQRSGKDSESTHSISSVRSVMSNVSSFWTGLGITSGGGVKSEKARAALDNDIKYLYSSMTKVPCLKISQDRRSRMISGYEEFPFDTAVPLIAFKNVSALEIYDTDFRQLYGWDRIAEQLRSLTIKRGHVDDPRDLLVNIVLDDIERRRRRSSKPQRPATPMWNSSPSVYQADGSMSTSPKPIVPASSNARRPQLYQTGDIEIAVARNLRRGHNQSASPTRPHTSQVHTVYSKSKEPHTMRRTGSGSSDSSSRSGHRPYASRSSSNLLSLGILPPTKWRMLRHLSLADNGLTCLETEALTPLSTGLISLDLSSNLFTDIPEGLSQLSMLRALNLSSCLIEGLGQLSHLSLPAVESFNLRANRLSSLVGLEKLPSLARIDLRENQIGDPDEIGRLASVSGIREIYVTGNPFTVTHPNYRIRLFNMFRSVPAYREDIAIDGRYPSYSERKQLNERTKVLKEDGVETSQRSLAETKVVRHLSSRVVTKSKVNEPMPMTTQPATMRDQQRKLHGRKGLVDLSTDGLRAERYEASMVDLRRRSCAREGSQNDASETPDTTEGEMDDKRLVPQIEPLSISSDVRAARSAALQLERKHDTEWLTALSEVRKDHVFAHRTAVGAASVASRSNYTFEHGIGASAGLRTVG